MKVELVSYSSGQAGSEFEGKSIDEIIVGMARVSSAREVNELFVEPEKLLRHCLTQQHWSVFAEANLTFKIQTTRAMGRELLRHDFRPQEFSQRYSEVTEFEHIELRSQSVSNRQSSTDLILRPDLDEKVRAHIESTENLYRELISEGVARECSRFILPESASTTLYLNGTIRVWLSFLNQRLHKTAQKEIRLIAEAVRDIFIEKIPVISKMMYNFEDAYECHAFERIVLEKYGVYNMIKANGFQKEKKNKKS